MRVNRPVTTALIVGAAAFSLVACGRSQPAGTGAGSQTPAQAEVVRHMHEHLAQVEEVQQAVVRGDLEDARAAAKRFAEHQPLNEVPEAVKPVISDMLQAAMSVSAAVDIKTAGDGTAAMVAACGSCHRSMSATPALPAAPAAVKASNPTAARMHEHQVAIDLLYRGLIVPSDELWTKGARALRQSPLKADAFPVDVALAREALDAQSRAHEAAEKALDAVAPWQRSRLYGEMIGQCATCHALSGRVLGAGLPKK